MKLRGISNNWSLAKLAASTNEADRAQYKHIVSLIDIQTRQQPDVSAHAGRVGELAGRITRVLGGTPAQAATMELAGQTHDIGKLLVPVEIMDKPGALTPGEKAVMASHTCYGAALLNLVPGPVTRFLATVALLHHERADGSGYHKRPGQRVPWPARIVAVADQADALMQARCYKPPMSLEESLETLTAQWRLGHSEKAPHSVDNRALGGWVLWTAFNKGDDMNPDDLRQYCTLAAHAMGGIQASITAPGYR